MIWWEGEELGKLVTTFGFHISDLGPLAGPVHDFSVSRDDQMDIILETSGPATMRAPAPPFPPGTVREVDGKVIFSNNTWSPEATAVARGLNKIWEERVSHSDGSMVLKEKFSVSSLEIELKNGNNGYITIDWLENVRRDGYFWSGSYLREKLESSVVRSIGSGEESIVLSGSGDYKEIVSHNCLKLSALGMVFYLCVSNNHDDNKIKNPGYIIYRDLPSKETRCKIINILSFCIGVNLIHVGTSTLDKNSDLISHAAYSPNGLREKTLDIPISPPSPLSEHLILEIKENIVSAMVEKIYAHYDFLKFGDLMWLYWHAIAAPVHIAAVHFGAAIEAIEAQCTRVSGDGKQTKIIEDKNKWETLRKALLGLVSDVDLDTDSRAIIENKISNLNQMPRSVIVNKFHIKSGINLSDIEKSAWKRRHASAHGVLSESDIVSNIRETKILRVLFHRMILILTDANDRYFDYYTIGHPIRNTADPIS